ncbi:MAG: hypothetical protein ABUS48_00910 [Pseudomonadota bacterium]
MAKRRSLTDILGGDPAPPKTRGRKVEDHRQQLVLAQADFTRIKTAKLAGVLIERAEAQRLWESAVVECRQTLAAIPARSAEAAGLTKKQAAWLESELRAALDAFAASGSVSDAEDR